MKLITNPENWIVRLIKQPDLEPLLEFSTKEIEILEQAISICDNAEKLLKYEGEMNEFGWASIYLTEILEEVRR